MSWTLFQWIWRLDTPLYLGMPPAGALNRCRPYVMARTLWGALTAEISRSSAGNRFPDYDQCGQTIAECCRFTYLYPAEEKNGERIDWLPQYTTEKGYTWAGDGYVSNRNFRKRLFEAKPGTAIDPHADAALDGTLREMECIQPRWSEPGCAKPKDRLLCGYIFSKDDELSQTIARIDQLSIGGDTRYGLGKISRLLWRDLPAGSTLFGRQVRLDEEHPAVCSSVILGHARDSSAVSSMKGMKERIGGWDRGKRWIGDNTWTPGSSLDSEVWWLIDASGYWRHREMT